MLLEEMDKEVVNFLYMDVDFLERTTLKLISDNEYETLILNFKVDINIKYGNSLCNEEDRRVFLIGFNRQLALRVHQI